MYVASPPFAIEREIRGHRTSEQLALELDKHYKGCRSLGHGLLPLIPALFVRMLLVETVFAMTSVDLTYSL